jgi:hypothetical protein
LAPGIGRLGDIEAFTRRITELAVLLLHPARAALAWGAAETISIFLDLAYSIWWIRRMEPSTRRTRRNLNVERRMSPHDGNRTRRSGAACLASFEIPA